MVPWYTVKVVMSPFAFFSVSRRAEGLGRVDGALPLLQPGE